MSTSQCMNMTRWKNAFLWSEHQLNQSFYTARLWQRLDVHINIHEWTARQNFSERITGFIVVSGYGRRGLLQRPYRSSRGEEEEDSTADVLQSVFVAHPGVRTSSHARTQMIFLFFSTLTHLILLQRAMKKSLRSEVLPDCSDLVEPILFC